MMASAGGGEDPDDHRKGRITEINPDVSDDDVPEEEGEQVSDSDDSSVFDTDAEDQLRESLKAMTLSEKKNLEKTFTTKKDKIDAKVSLLKNEIRKEQRSIKKEEKKALSMEKQREKKEEARIQRELEITVNFRFNGQMIPIRTRPSNTLGNLRTRFFLDAQVKGKDQKKMRFIFNNINLFETYQGRATLTRASIVDGSVIDVFVSGEGGGKRGRASMSKTNPFEEKKVEHPVLDKEEEKNLWQSVFAECVKISASNEFDEMEVLKTISKQSLVKTSKDLISGKSRIDDKLISIAKETKISKDIYSIIETLTYNFDKHNQMVAKKLYDMGSVDGKFDSGVVAGIIKQICGVTGWELMKMIYMSYVNVLHVLCKCFTWPM